MVSQDSLPLSRVRDFYETKFQLYEDVRYICICRLYYIVLRLQYYALYVPLTMVKGIEVEFDKVILKVFSTLCLELTHWLPVVFLIS